MWSEGEGEGEEEGKGEGEISCIYNHYRIKTNIRRTTNLAKSLDNIYQITILQKEMKF